MTSNVTCSTSGARSGGRDTIESNELRDRDPARTGHPREASSRTSRRPTFPVAPATNTVGRGLEVDDGEVDGDGDGDDVMNGATKKVDAVIVNEGGGVAGCCRW